MFMNDNLSLKRTLIMQSFAPLFLILFIKYFDLAIFKLLKMFCINCICSPKETFIKAITHPLFITFLLVMGNIFDLWYKKIYSFAKSGIC